MGEDQSQRCKKCGESKPATGKFFWRRSSGTLRPLCKPCDPAWKRYQDYQRRWRKKTKDKVKLARPPLSPRPNIVADTGRTEEEWLDAFAAQNGRCATCGAASLGGSGADYCRQTKKRRELLCASCHKALDKVGDNPGLLFNLAIYVADWAAQHRGVSADELDELRLEQRRLLAHFEAWLDRAMPEP